MSYNEKEYCDLNNSDPSNPSIIEPAGVGMGWLIMPIAVALLLAVGSVVLYVVLSIRNEQVTRHENSPVYQSSIKEYVHPSPETCALPDDLCHPGVGPEMPAESRPDPYVVAPPPTSAPRPPATCPPQVPPTDQVTPPPDLVPD